MPYPIHRLRRLRRNEIIRSMVSENRLSTRDLIQPLFVVPGSGVRKEISTIRGNYHLSIDKLVEEAKEIRDLQIPAVLLFGVPDKKDEQASGAYDPDGIVQKCVGALKEQVAGLVVITDVCLCEYTPHGHCGIIETGYLNNDLSLDLLGKTALSHARAGCDMVAPAAMLDGQIGHLRNVLDGQGFINTAIMGYSAKFASKLYDPFFKDAAASATAFGDKRSHQMDSANGDEAMREIAFDIEEGADIVMVKPGIMYLDIVYRAKQRFGMPLAVYNVSGEYAMIMAAAEKGILDEKAMMFEALTACKRAGADMIITYFAKKAAQALR